MTDEEATEALQVAMTVGATRMQVMLNTEQTKLGAPPASPAPAPPAGAQPETAPPAAPQPSATPVAPPPSFTAAEVVPQAGGGCST